MDPYDLAERWRLPRPTLVEPVAGGTNNLSWRVEAGGEIYVARIYQNATPRQIEAEHRLLSALNAAGLPFHVPVPIPAVDGSTVLGQAALFPYLPGAPLRGGELLEAAGRALGDLNVALARMPAALAPTDWRRPLSEVHPAVPDVADLVAELTRVSGDHPGIAWLAAEAEPADEVYARLCATLPAQIVHGDWAPVNVLAEHGRITAVLDFEIAGLNLRITDPVAGAFNSTDDDDQAGAFLRGYRERVDLHPEELAAVPDLLRLRALGSVMWRAGRWRLGQSTLDHVRRVMDHGLELEARLRAVRRRSPRWACDVR